MASWCRSARTYVSIRRFEVRDARAHDKPALLWEISYFADDIPRQVLIGLSDPPLTRRQLQLCLGAFREQSEAAN